MKVIIKMENGKVKEQDIIIMEIDMKEIGKKIIEMEKVYIIGKMVIDMRGIGKMAKKKVKEYFTLMMEENM